MLHWHNLQTETCHSNVEYVQLLKAEVVRAVAQKQMLSSQLPHPKLIPSSHCVGISFSSVRQKSRGLHRVQW
jgi:hypothetical protein